MRRLKRRTDIARDVDGMASVILFGSFAQHDKGDFMSNQIRIGDWSEHAFANGKRMFGADNHFASVAVRM